MFIRQSLIYTAIGLVAGLVGVFAFKRHLEHLLYESSGDQFVVIASACLLLLIVSMIGCYLPARRATRINPLTALRSE